MNTSSTPSLKATVVIRNTSGVEKVYLATADTDSARGAALATAFSASAANDMIFIKAGNYSVSAPLVVKDSQVIILENANITNTVNTTNVFNCIDVSNWSIKGCGTLTGAGSNSGGTFTDECGIYIHSSDSSHFVANWLIEGLRINNFKGCGVFTDAIPNAIPWDKNGTLLNCFIETNNYGFYQHSGIASNASDYTIISNCHISYNTLDGINVWNGNQIISDCVLNKNNNGIYLNAGYNDGHGIISNCDINHNNAYGIVCDSLANGFTIADNHIINNGGNTNVHLISCSGVTISGGYIDSGQVVMTGTFTGMNYIRDVFSYTTGYGISATTAQRAWLRVTGNNSGTTQFPTYNDDYLTWVDFSSGTINGVTQSIVGWSSLSTNVIQVAVINKLCYVSYALIGTSNSTSISFQIPYTSLNVTGITNSQTNEGFDSVGSYNVTLISVAANGTTVNIARDATTGGSAWTASGTKRARGLIIIPIQ